MFKQVHDFSAVLLQLSNDAGIIKENTLLELTIGEYARLSQGHHVHFGLPGRRLKESIRASFVEIGESQWKRLSADSRLKGIFQFELRYVSVDQPTDSCLSGNKKPLKRCLSSFFVRVFGLKCECQLVEGRVSLSLEPVF